MNTTAAETRGSLNTGSITRSLSTGSYDNGDNSATVKQRKVPIYLRASTASCHDICKYGRGHAFEDKPKMPLRKRIAKTSLNEDTFIQILVSGEQNKENVDAKKHSINAKPSPRRPNARTEKSPETIKREITLPQDSIIDDKMSSSDQKTNPSSVKSKPVKAKPSDAVQPGGKVRASASASKSPLVPKSSLSKTASNKATQSGRVKSSAPPRKDQHTSNSQVSEKILHVIKIETANNPLESVSLSQENPSEEEVNGTFEFVDNKTLVMETENTILEPSLDSHIPFPPSSKSSSHRRSPSSLSSSSKSSFHRRSPSSSSSSKSSFHRRSPSTLSSSSKSSFHRRSPSSSSSSSKASPSHRRSPSSSSSKSSSSHSRSPSMTSVEVDEEIKHISKETDKPVSGKRTPAKIISKGTPPRGNLNNNVRKIKVVSCDDKPVKLKFRSGKVLDPPQDNNNNNNNNNIVRRLKFRRMRADGDKAEISVSHIQENIKTLRKSRVVVSEYKRRSPSRLFGGEKGDNNMPLRLRFRRGRIIGGDEGKADSKRNIRNGGFEGANVKMKLKHQLADLKGKKDGQCLFNNVIEETATKLAGSRKSKVLALVGAFETVISLHSPRP